MVPCPYNDCNYSTNVYSSFNSHKVEPTKQILHLTLEVALSVRILTIPKVVFPRSLVICMKNVQGSAQKWELMISMILTV